MEGAASDRWRQTRLWKALEERDPGAPGVKPMRQLLESWMKDIELVLAKSGTTQLRFTLHDADHGFRVAERMVEILPEETVSALSP